VRIVALIPARAGSKRCHGKNTRLLNGHPLIAYTIRAAQDSGVFADVWVSTEDDHAARLAMEYGARVISRSSEAAHDDAPDIMWVREFFQHQNADYNAFAILRPTSPFRTAAMIRRCYEQFIRDESHSTRAVEAVKQHPGKMWWNNGPGYPMTPVCDAKRSDGTPWHSSPTQTLPPAYVQNASLEMAWTYVLDSFGTISGRKISPFVTDGLEGFDINTEEDWREAERLALLDPRSPLPCLS
jgi:N-acylneuraminate cytidylyltransferase